MNLNIENIKAVRDAVASEKHWQDVSTSNGFDMSRFAHSCGTPSCIAGWAVALKYGNPRSLPADIVALYGADIVSTQGFYSRVAKEAADWLGLDEDDADDLFCSSEWTELLRGVTPEQAVTVLDHLIMTGEVDWSVAGEDF